MTDNVSKETRRKIMQSVKSQNTNLENKISKELWKRGYRFRRNVKDLYGKPDIAIKKYKIVIFIDSCFWHGCEKHCRMPVSNISFWNKKINKNIKRDSDVNLYYLNLDWNLMRLWEHQVNENFDDCINNIIRFVEDIKSSYKQTK